ncbi:MAG: hypothetical protein ACUVX9_19305, partial [Anaerolineae bacterium]
MGNSINQATTLSQADGHPAAPIAEIQRQAEEALNAGDWAEATTLLRRALGEHSDWGEGLAHMGLCLAHQGQLY